MSRRNTLVTKVGVVDIDLHVSSHIKEELAWAVDKQLQVIICAIMLFKKL